MKEKKLFIAQYAIITKKTEKELAIWWCSRVHEVNIFPKLPVHFCMHPRKWLITGSETVWKAKTATDKCKEINDKLSPFYSNMATMTSTSTARAPAPAGADAVTHAFPAVKRPAMMPQPTLTAMHNNPCTLVGGTMCGTNTGEGGPSRNIRGKEKNKRTTKRCPKCRVLKIHDNDPEHRCTGATQCKCDYCDDSSKRRCWKCWKFGRESQDPYTCPATRINRDDCKYFGPRFKIKYKRKYGAL